MHPNLKSAFAKLEQAQKTINEAGCDLCAVPGFSDEWSAVVGLHSRVRTVWHLIDLRRAELEAEQDLTISNE